MKEVDWYIVNQMQMNIGKKLNRSPFIRSWILTLNSNGLPEVRHPMSRLYLG